MGPYSRKLTILYHVGFIKPLSKAAKATNPKHIIDDFCNGTFTVTFKVMWVFGTMQQKKARTVNHVIEQICQSGAQGVLLKDIKRRVYSWYDQGREWNDIVRAAGSGDILLFLPSKPIRHSLAPTASATKYRDLDSSQAQVVMNMLQEVLPSANFLGNELLFETFLFHRPPDKLFRIEELSDNDIRNVSIYSKQAFGLLTESRGTN
ncbi:hypothetical protein BDV33DRAFT_204603 [Aspergillus novoparasiticus]|uniref:Uncharacterized protein n=1 Tax=Aspergillus novoparasiticus TaxID=986946 RepID=A0A5N6EQI5_9EURO|nr:hypothetical protein BDV33DRAFT_204603 [Aspergillus novoparasiticus]